MEEKTKNITKKVSKKKIVSISDLLLNLFIIISPLLSGLYFEKHFIVADIFLIYILLINIINNFFDRGKYIVEYHNVKNIDNKNVNNVNNVNNLNKFNIWLKKIIIFSVVLILCISSTYIINRKVFLEEINYKLLLYGVAQVGEILLFTATCCNSFKSSINNKCSEDKYKIVFQDIAIMISGMIQSIFMLSSVYYRNHRLEGSFGYANALGIFLLISIIVINNMDIDKIESKNLSSYGNMVIRNILLYLKRFTLVSSIIAIILTNSRSTFCLLVLYLLVLGINRKNKTKKLKNESSNNKIYNIRSIIAGGIVSIAIIAIIIGLFNIKEIAARASLNIIIRDVKLRFSYLAEAVDIITRRPFGLGYEGYLNVQSVKENKYILRLVHNMPLQIMLNYGIHTFIFLLVYLIKYLRIIFDKGEHFAILILIIFFLHSLCDIGASFLVIDNLIVLVGIRSLVSKDNDIGKDKH